MFCSLKQYNELSTKIFNQTNDIVTCKDSINNVTPSEVKAFIDNNILNIIDMFRNTLSYDIRNGLLDSYGNIVNFLLRMK